MATHLLHKQQLFLVMESPSDYAGDLIALRGAADVALVVLDARKGLRSRTRECIYLISLLGIRRIVMAVNKMDLVDYDSSVFATIERECRAYAARIGTVDITCIPTCGTDGANVVEHGETMRWHDGPTVLEYLGRAAAEATFESPSDPGTEQPPDVAAQFEATIVWKHQQPMLQGRSYTLKCGARTVSATVAPLKYRIDSETLAHVPAKVLEIDEIGVCNIELSAPIAFATDAKRGELGGFTLLDPVTNTTVGAGLWHFALRRSGNVHWQAVDIDKNARAILNGHKPCVLWFTGLSGAGKSTIANLVEKRLHALGLHTYLLDGDNVRHGLNKDLGFTVADRVENIRRVAEVAHLMADAGLIVLVSFISPFRAERRMARGLVGEREFVEVFVDTPLSVAEGRDPKGLYRKARRGELKNFTGIDSPYEAPDQPEIRIDTTRSLPDQAVDEILAQLRRREMIEY